MIWEDFIRDDATLWRIGSKTMGYSHLDEWNKNISNY
jgi:hypothetical protein